jgi:hypothetical protein
MTNQFVNAAAEFWAKENLARGLEIKLLHNSILSRIMVGLGIGFLALVFLGIPALLFYSAAARYAGSGWSGEVSRAVVLGSIFLVSFMAFTAFLLFYLWNLRRNQVTLLTSEGVRTRGGRYFEWKHLRNLKFVRVETAVRGGSLLRFTTRAMYRDAQKIKVEMFFSNAAAPAVIPPLIANQGEILELLKTVPVERRAAP